VGIGNFKKRSRRKQQNRRGNWQLQEKKQQNRRGKQRNKREAAKQKREAEKQKRIEQLKEGEERSDLHT